MLETLFTKAFKSEMPSAITLNERIKKAKKILVVTVVLGQIAALRRRFGA